MWNIFKYNNWILINKCSKYLDNNNLKVYVLTYSSDWNYRFPEFTPQKNASLLMITNDVFTGAVSASTPLATKMV